MIWVGIAVWLSGVFVGAAFSGAVFYFWLRGGSERLYLVLRYLLTGLAEYNGGRFIKLYASLFDTRRCSKVMVYAKPEDVAEALGWYSRPLPYQDKDDSSPREKDPSGSP